MMKRITTLLTLLMLINCIGFAQKDKDNIIKSLDAQASEFTKVAKQIWENPELGYLEEKSSALLKGELEKAGFKI
ncbi:MAG: amidohydrolase, partial [Cyclobacteriaceae bacterium]